MTVKKFGYLPGKTRGIKKSRQVSAKRKCTPCVVKWVGVEGLTFLSLGFDVFSSRDQVRDPPII